MLHTFCSPARSSDWSVVFVFSASLSARAPSSPILLPACSCWLLACLLCFDYLHLLIVHFSVATIGVLCWRSMFRSVHVLLHRRSHCLFAAIRCWKSLQFLIFATLFFHLPDSVIVTLRWSSMLRSMHVLLCRQFHFLVVEVGCWQCLQFIHLPHFLLARFSDSLIGVLCFASLHRSVLVLHRCQSHFLLVEIGCWCFQQFILHKLCSCSPVTSSD